MLNGASRRYALTLMAQVIASQRWGVPAGAPADLTVHVKNGWLPLATHGWRIHGIGCFTGHHRGYSIVVLTEDNPSMAYGVTTIQQAAEVIHRHSTRPGMHSSPPRPRPRRGARPDEQIPRPSAAGNRGRAAPGGPRPERRRENFCGTGGTGAAAPHV